MVKFNRSCIEIGWQLQYDNDLYGLLEQRGFDTSDEAIRSLVLGGETAMWSEQVTIAIPLERRVVLTFFKKRLVYHN